nr:MAG TPA: hypothetical protein [Caudoviricetes sp.]
MTTRIAPRQGSGFGGLLFLSAPLIVGRALLFYSVPCHLFARLCGPMSYPYTLYRSTLLNSSCDVLDGLAVISLQYCYCYDVLQCA